MGIGLKTKKRKQGKGSNNESWCVFLPKRKVLPISVHIICSVRAENELWEEEGVNPSEDLTRLSDEARGLSMNNASGRRGRGADILALLDQRVWEQ